MRRTEKAILDDDDEDDDEHEKRGEQRVTRINPLSFPPAFL